MLEVPQPEDLDADLAAIQRGENMRGKIRTAYHAAWSQQQAAEKARADAVAEMQALRAMVAEKHRAIADIEADESDNDDISYCEEPDCPLKARYAHQHVNESLFANQTKTEDFMRGL